MTQVRKHECFCETRTPNRWTRAVRCVCAGILRNFVKARVAGAPPTACFVGRGKIKEWALFALLAFNSSQHCRTQTEISLQLKSPLKGNFAKDKELKLTCRRHCQVILSPCKGALVENCFCLVPDSFSFLGYMPEQQKQEPLPEYASGAV